MNIKQANRSNHNTIKTDQSEDVAHCEIEERISFRSPEELSELAKPTLSRANSARLTAKETKNDNLGNDRPLCTAGANDPLATTIKFVVSSLLASMTCAAACMAFEVLNAPCLDTTSYNPLSELLQTTRTLKDFALIELGLVDQFVLHPPASAPALVTSDLANSQANTREWIIYRALTGQMPNSFIPAVATGSVISLVLNYAYWSKSKGR